MNKQLLKQITAITVSISLLAGCASMDTNSKDTATGAGIGGVAGFVLGKVAHINPVVTTVVGAGVGAFIGHEYALKQARELAKEAQAQHLNAVVTTEQVKQSDGQTHEELSKFVLPLNPQDVSARGDSTKKLLIKAADIANGNKSGQKITVSLFGSTNDLQWMSFVVSGELNDKNAIQVHQSSAPRLELSPVPTLASK